MTEKKKHVETNYDRIDVMADTGMETTPGMWEMLSDLLIGESLPEPINQAIYALRDGKAKVIAQ